MTDERPTNDPGCGLERRWFLRNGGLGLGALALSALLRRDGLAAAAQEDLLRAKAPMHPARAKRVVCLNMVGAPSQIDLFEDKPELNARDGQPCPESLLEGRRFAFIGAEKRLAGTRWKFARHGASGHTLSELLPCLAKVADDIAIVRSLQTEEINHAPAQLFQRTGFGRAGRPSFGSWVTYGLGSENQDLPAYVVLRSGPLAGAGTALWSSGFLPSALQGTPFLAGREPVLFLDDPPGQERADRRRILDAVRALNRMREARVGDPEIDTRIRQYELAHRMQLSVPELADLASEPREVLELYGAQPGRPSFANNCLLARRLLERGVRVVELYDADWDHHSGIANALPKKCKDVDQASAALVADLKRLGLLEDTLVVWGGEFGRTPLAQLGIAGTNQDASPGRDHNQDAYTMWLAGGGIRPGAAVGSTDDLGFEAVECPVHQHDLNATILHLLGLDHERLTFRFQGREFRLTDVHGRVVPELLA